MLPQEKGKYSIIKYFEQQKEKHHIHVTFIIVYC
jgi:hypothetical protein